MAYNENNVAKLKDLVSLATKTKAAIEAAVSDLPVEMFLDQAKTTFVPSFTWSNALYPGSTNPNKAAVEADPEADPPVVAQPAVVFDGKPVLVLAVKGVDNADPTDTSKQTTTYSFLDMQTLVDTYTVKTGTSAQILNISGYEIEVKFDNTLTTSANGLGVAVSAVANNAITKKSDGLHVDITGKADKVDRATAAEAQNPYDPETESANYAAFNSSYVLTGHVAGLDASGNLTDTGIVAANVLTTANITTDAEVEEALDGVFGSSGSGD